MESPEILEAVCERLRAEYNAHTILLYGSVADGSANADSDLDIAAFGAVNEVIRIAERQQGTYIDAFIYPEDVLEDPQEEHLRFRGSKILLQKAGLADGLLKRLDEKYNLGPKALPEDEIEARRVWAGKMVARIKREDVEGNYRRVWLLTALLEDYFHLRGLWFEGPKKALRWLNTHDASTLNAMNLALKPDASIAAIEVAVDHVLGEQISDQADASGFG